MKNIDNVTLFNKLTHFPDESVDEKVLEHLLYNFTNYRLIHNFLAKLDNPEYNIEKAILSDNLIWFHLKFDNNEIVNRMKVFLKKNLYTRYKGRSYQTIYKFDDNTISLHFIKREESDSVASRHI